MSYEKQNFVKGQILKAEHLNHMEMVLPQLLLAYRVLKETKETLVRRVRKATRATLALQQR